MSNSSSPSSMNNTVHMMRERTRAVIDLVDYLRKIGLHKKIPIPQIAVMGDQSSGKSSVLEAISGIPFPRGSGLVTRCPTMVIMSQGCSWKAEISIQDSDPLVIENENEKEKISEHITKLTNELAGDGNDFAGENEFIEIKLRGPDVPDLTIIDLPGIVRTIVDGQNKNVMEQVQNMLSHYLKQTRTVVLAVIPANVDIATSEILEKANQVDPEGERTVGVLTKPDLVDKGAEEEVRQVLMNRSKPLKHGYFMLKNRSQANLDSQMSIEDSRKDEMAYFKKSEYHSIPGIQDKLGVEALSTALTEILVKRIEVAIPTLSKEVDKMLEDANGELQELGYGSPETLLAKRMRFSDISRNVLIDLRKVMERVDNFSEKHEASLISQERKYRKEFEKAVRKTKPGFHGEKDTFKVEHTSYNGEIREKILQLKKGKKIGDNLCINNEGNWKITERMKHFRGELFELMQCRRGRELPGFLNFNVFSSLIEDYVNLWQKPSKIFQDNVHTFAIKTAHIFAKKHAAKFPRLCDRLLADIDKYYKTIQEIVRERLGALLDQEKIPSTENHYLWDTINKLRNDRVEKKINGISDATVYEKKSSSTALASGYVKKTELIEILKSTLGNASNESQEVDDMIDMLEAYWKLAKKRYVDEVGMIITDGYTNPIHANRIEKMLQETLFNANDEDMENYFFQDEKQRRKRKQLEETVKIMESASRRLCQGI